LTTSSSELPFDEIDGPNSTARSCHPGSVRQQRRLLLGRDPGHADAAGLSQYSDRLQKIGAGPLGPAPMVPRKAYRMRGCGTPWCRRWRPRAVERSGVHDCRGGCGRAGSEVELRSRMMVSVLNRPCELVSNSARDQISRSSCTAVESARVILVPSTRRRACGVPLV
jgi:hypothetical protein